MRRRDHARQKEKRRKLKKLLIIILAAITLIPVAAGISVNTERPWYADGLSELEKRLADDPESGCFAAIAIRKYDPDADLTAFGRLIASKEMPVNTVTAMKYALTVYACGVRGSIYDDIGHDRIAEAQSTSALVFSLHLKNIGYDTGMTADEHIERLLSRRVEGSGFPTIGTTPDIDMTSMAIQALAPYKKDPVIAAAIEEGLAFISSRQSDTGAFRYFNSENCENCAQAIIALTSLGIDPEKDGRFIKNGNSVYDALLSYRLENGRFEHILGSGENATATAQAYCALVNRDRMTPFYVVDAPSKNVDVSKSSGKAGLSLTAVLVIVVIAAGAVVCVIFAFMRKKRVWDYVIVAVITAAVAVFLAVSGVRTGKDYFSSSDDIKVTGHVTFSVDCSLVSDRKMIKPVTVGIQDGDTAYSVLIRACRQNGLTVINAGSAVSPYITGIGDLYEASFGPTSGWGYRVNGKAPSVGAGACKLSDGDVVEWIYVPDVSYLGD